jgi:hypothetical protein
MVDGGYDRILELDPSGKVLARSENPGTHRARLRGVIFWRLAKIEKSMSLRS